jgi:hypothetical protein
MIDIVVILSLEAPAVGALLRKQSGPALRESLKDSYGVAAASGPAVNIEMAIPVNASREPAIVDYLTKVHDDLSDSTELDGVNDQHPAPSRCTSSHRSWHNR